MLARSRHVLMLGIESRARTQLAAVATGCTMLSSSIRLRRDFGLRIRDIELLVTKRRGSTARLRIIASDQIWKSLRTYGDKRQENKRLHTSSAVFELAGRLMICAGLWTRFPNQGRRRALIYVLLRPTRSEFSLMISLEVLAWTWGSVADL